MSFLKRAREMPHPDKPFLTRGELAKKCWPEILAVIDAAELATHRWDDHEMSQASADETICCALDALEKKVDE